MEIKQVSWGICVSACAWSGGWRLVKRDINTHWKTNTYLSDSQLTFASLFFFVKLHEFKHRCDAHGRFRKCQTAFGQGHNLTTVEPRWINENQFYASVSRSQNILSEHVNMQQHQQEVRTADRSEAPSGLELHLQLPLQLRSHEHVWDGEWWSRVRGSCYKRKHTAKMSRCMQSYFLIKKLNEGMCAGASTQAWRTSTLWKKQIQGTNICIQLVEHIQYWGKLGRNSLFSALIQSKLWSPLFP